MTDIKISIIGAGFVGATTAFCLMEAGVAAQILLIDIDQKKAEGEAMDLQDGMSFVPPVRISAGTPEDCRDSNIVIFTAGANQRQGETRLDLAGRNVAILKEIVPVLCRVCPETILLMVTNPVDVLTYAALKLGGFSPDRVIGSGTVLDSSRFRQALSEHYGIDARSIHAYVVGEHGDSEVPLWSHSNIAGALLDELKSFQGIDREVIFDSVKNAAYQIIERKGATYYAIALSVRRIVEALLGNENSILPVSSLVEGQYDIRNVCLSLPCIVNSNGRQKILELNMSEDEQRALQQSADKLKQVISRLNY